MSTLKVNAITNLSNQAQYGPILGTEQATTSGTVFEFTGLPTWVQKISVIFNEVSLSGGDDFLVQLSTGGVFVTTGYLSTSNSMNQASGTTGASSTAGMLVYSGLGANVCSGIMTLVRVNASHTWINSHAVKRATTLISTGGGSLALATVLDGIRITRTGTNTFDAGSVNIMYE